MGEKRDPSSVLRRKLLRVLKERIVSMGVSQKVAAIELGLTQPEISLILADDPTKFSTDRLIRILSNLGLGISVRLRPKKRTLYKAIG